MPPVQAADSIAQPAASSFVALSRFAQTRSLRDGESMRLAPTVFGSLLVAVGMAVALTRCANNGAREDAGAARGAWWFETTGGPVLVVNDDVRVGRSERSRLVAVDGKTGQRLATRVFDRGGLMCAPATSARLWCQRSELDLLDARTLASVDNGTLRREGLATAHGLALTQDAAWIVRADGRVARVDATTLAVTEGKALPDSTVTLSAAEQCRGPTEATLGRKALAFGSGPRRALTIDGKESATTFLEPHFARTAAGTVLTLPDSLLVEHNQSLDNLAHHQLSRVDATGRLLWTTDIVGRCELAVVDGTALIVAAGSGKQRASALDVATGTVRWRLVFD